MRYATEPMGNCNIRYKYAFGMNFLFHFKSLQGKVEKWAPNGLFEEVERPHPIWTNEASLDTSNATS